MSNKLQASGVAASHLLQLLLSQRLLLPLLFLPPLLAGHFAGYGGLCAAALVVHSLGTGALRPASVALVFAARGHLLRSVGNSGCSRGVAAPTSAGAKPREAASPPTRAAGVIVIDVRPLSNRLGSSVVDRRLLLGRCVSVQPDHSGWQRRTHL